MKTKSQAGDFRNILERISHQHDISRVFEGFTRLAACALAAQTREAEYLEEAKRWEKRELELFAEALSALIIQMEAQPFEDLIGEFYMECALSEKGKQRNGEFHTPKSICDLMAQMLMDSNSMPVQGPIAICDPACGAGAMILSFAQACPPGVRHRLRVTAIDINRTACDMTFINTTLWGIPTRVIHGNSLSLEFWSAWSNVHHLVPWLGFGVMFSKPESFDQGQPPHPDEVERIKASLIQQEFGLV